VEDHEHVDILVPIQKFVEDRMGVIKSENNLRMWLGQDVSFYTSCGTDLLECSIPSHLCTHLVESIRPSDTIIEKRSLPMSSFRLDLENLGSNGLLGVLLRDKEKQRRASDAESEVFYNGNDEISDIQDEPAGKFEEVIPESDEAMRAEGSRSRQRGIAATAREGIDDSSDEEPAVGPLRRTAVEK
jgi:hypothetical protein